MDENGSGDDLPVWMKTIDEETFYNSAAPDSADEDSSEDQAPVSEEEKPPQTATSPSSKDSAPNDESRGLEASDLPESSGDMNREGAKMSLRQKLSISMADPKGLPAPDPTLQPVALGYVRADLNEQVERAVALLDTRYESKFSKTLFLDVALRQILIDLHAHGEESSLVSWLDSILNVE